MKHAALLAFGLAVGLAFQLPSSGDSAQTGRVRIGSRQADGATWWSVQAEQVPLDRFLYELGAKAGLDVEGLAALGLNALLTVDLEDRPLEQVLEFALGSVGLSFQLRRDTIEVRDERLGAPDAETALVHASFAWLTATTRFPDHPSAPHARLAQGEIAEARGNLVAALDTYNSLESDYADAPATLEGRMRAGRLLERLGRWQDASAQFRGLANDPDAVEYHAQARLEIARAAVRLGDPQSALYLLESLASDYPSDDPLDRTGRVIVRAMALNALGRNLEALRTLDAEGPTLDPMGGADAIRVRAESLVGLGLYSEASQAWIQYARQVDGPERTRALRQAAAMALDGGDEMGVLFASQEAERLGEGPALTDLREEARRRLGLTEPPPDAVAVADRLTLAETWLDRGTLERAAPIFESLYVGRAALAPEQAVRVTVGWARCVESRRGLDEAIRILSEARPALTSIDLKARLDVAAADLFEKHERFDAAIDAYRGRY